MNCLLFLQYGPEDNLVEIFPLAFLWIHWLPKIHAKLDLKIIGLATGLPGLASLACLVRHGGSHWCFNFSSIPTNGFFELLVLRSMKQIPRNLLALTSFGFSCDHFCLSISSHFDPEFWP